MSAVPEHRDPGHPDPNTPTASPGNDYQGRHHDYDDRHRADPDGLSVWTTAQTTGPVQRRGRYVPESVKHPARMLPAIAAHAIDAYTQPGDLVLDPMCGIGTTLVEAVHAGRDAFGIEYEPQWSNIADANIRHAHDQGATGRASVIRGDATRLISLVPKALTGQVALVVTSPPYGPTVHGLVRPGADGVVKYDDRYNDGEDRGNLAYRDLTGLADGFTQILAGCATLLRPGGVVVVTARPWRKRGELVDLPSAVIAAGIRAGLVPIERCVALLAAVRDGHLVARPSFFQLQQVRKARAGGVPMHLIAHEDVLILAKQPTPRATPDSGGGVVG
ncbi:TRM11 family SAM-dependent methyltransferase [Micromonospora maris]|uniref:Methyltransferase n=1 Tax=Micromonospora maris TaxID=1003110 RepID=A0A9X0I6P6_9ACTN|nr:DNA methyltransferase [Micromonospora maris]AEB42610.1 DNA methylase N-4/N-6 domain-containing protein [Micromonospora maris AB-18-032]KUJ48054.1 RNA methyltransferase [Micromonospora maris]